MLRMPAVATAREIAAGLMTAPGTAQAVETDFETLTAVAWPGERLFGELTERYHGHRILVVRVTEHVAGPAPLGGLLSCYDETQAAPLAAVSWEAGGCAPFDVHRLGRVVTFEVPAEALTPPHPHPPRDHASPP